MNIQDLPEEVIIMIIRLLDIQSQHNFYYTNTYFKNIVSSHGVVNACQFSLNTMATANSLKSDFFKDISGHLQELNLRAVNDLNKTLLIPTIRKLKKLTTLDVSYTRITISDLLEMFQVCPTLKDVSINFTFKKSGQAKIPLQMLRKCQNMFEHFERVHFVGALINLFYSNLPLTILQKAKLCELQFTITDCDHTIYDSNVTHTKMVQFKQLKIFLLNWKKKNQFYGLLNESVILSVLDLSKYEIIIVHRCDLNSYKVTASYGFKNFFQEHFGVNADIITEWAYEKLGGNVAILMWDTESTIFDDSFFLCLCNQLKQFFPYYVPSANSKVQVPAKFDWFFTKPTQHEFSKSEKKLEPQPKRRRLARQDVILNYDSVCKEKRNIQISILFDKTFKCPVALSNGCDYLKKITYISLSGHIVYSSDFFKILFQCCINLVTINSTTSPNSAQALGHGIPLSKYIKNVRIVASTIDFKSFFHSLSQCKYIENVHLIDESSGSHDLPEPQEMFQKCSRLYNLSICLPISDNMRTRKIQMLNKLKTKYGRHHLNIELYSSLEFSAFGYDPFIEVFNLNPIKIV